MRLEAPRPVTLDGRTVRRVRGNWQTDHTDPTVTDYWTDHK